MADRIAIWMDHDEAQIIEADGEVQKTATIASGAESKRRATGGTHMSGKSFAKSPASGDGHYEGRRANALQHYYAEVVKVIGDASDVLILGPGTAKDELSHRLGDRSSRRVRVETSSRLTDGELLARVRKAFAPRSSP
jgi:hypothetical protein